MRGADLRKAQVFARCWRAAAGVARTAARCC